MPRVSRVDVGGYVYHVLNRANARVQIFDRDEDYASFEEVLEEGNQRFAMPILAYCVMPNHWHFVLHPKDDGDLARYIGWITNTHTRRWHTERKTIGQGHLYQGRYKSFLCQKDNYLLALLRYVESNAQKANLVKNAEDWRWSSVWRRKKGNVEAKKLIAPWPIDEPEDYMEMLNTPQNKEEEEIIECAIKKNTPFGESSWINQMVEKFSLGQTLREGGRPKNGG